MEPLNTPDRVATQHTLRPFEVPTSDRRRVTARNLIETDQVMYEGEVWEVLSVHETRGRSAHVTVKLLDKSGNDTRTLTVPARKDFRYAPDEWL